MKNYSGKELRRSVSPMNPQTIEISERKKKSNSNKIYVKVSKQFETYGKPDRKINTIHNRQSLIMIQPKTKYRIVTEPVDDRIMHLANPNVFNTSIVRNQKQKFPHQNQPESIIKFNIKSSQSKEKLRTIQCKQCEKYKHYIDLLKNQMNTTFNLKKQWKNGQLTLHQLKQQMTSQLNFERSNIFDIISIINDTKKHIYDLMKDIQSLSTIDYAKMLSLDIFTYRPSSNTSSQYNEIKSLLSSLRQNIEGKVTEQDIDEMQNSSRTSFMLRNLKSKLNHTLRQNIQLRMKIKIMSKADDLFEESQDQLKKIIQEVLLSYQKHSKQF